MRVKSLIVLLFVLLVGCGSGAKDGISVDDLAIVKVDDESQVVKYGMSREEVESVLGQPEEKYSSKYPYGIDVKYREDKIVLLRLTEESEGSFKIFNGAKIGMTKDDVIKLYGEDNVQKSSESLSVYYDTEQKKYLDEKMIEEYPPEEYTNVLMTLIYLDANGKVTDISTGDAWALIVGG